MEIVSKRVQRRLVFDLEHFSGYDELPQPTIEKVEYSTVKNDEGKVGNFLRILTNPSNPYAKKQLPAQFA